MPMMVTKKLNAGILFALAFLFLLLFIWLRIPIADEMFDEKTGTLILDRNGRVLFFDTSEDEQYLLPRIATEKISPYFVTAVVLLEDEGFFSHNGIDHAAVFRALVQNIRAQRIVSGASTLSLQLAKNLLGHKERTWWNKWQEALYALRLETQFDKNEIFAMWANKAPFGSNIVGINAASQYYFRKSPQELSLAQATFLAGIPNNPERYSPLTHPNAATERKDRVLQLLFRNDLISEGGLIQAQNEQVDFFVRPPPIIAPHFVMRTIANLPKASVVRTTLDIGLQSQMESIIERHLDFLQGHNVGNAAAIVIENSTGAIRGYVGNADYFNENTAGQVDILRSYRQVGSTLKPFLYYLAFRDLGWTADTTILDEPVGFETAIGTEFEPKNFDLTYRGAMSVRDALAESRNIPAVRTLAEVGEGKLFALLSALEAIPLQSAADAGLSAALGAAEIRLIDLARAYAVLAREGRSLRLCLVEPCFPQSGEPILTQNLTLEITSILSDNVARVDAFGEGSALEFDFAVAAKTGTSRNFRDNFAVGYTPNFTVLVWVGNSDGSAMEEVSGITGAGPIFHEIVKATQRIYPLKMFRSPPLRTADTVTVAALRILSPLPGATFRLDPERPSDAQKIRFATNISADFVLNDESLGSGTEVLWTPQLGEHRLVVTDDEGNRAQVGFFVRD